MTIRLFSAYVADQDADAWRISFSCDEDYKVWLEEAKSRSCFTSDVIPNPSDQVVTLSTCSYDFPNARFVCHGLVEKS